MVNREEDLNSEDRKDSTDQTPNLATTDLRAETDPREGEISPLEEEDSELVKVNQDSIEAEANKTEISQSKGGFHL